MTTLVVDRQQQQNTHNVDRKLTKKNTTFIDNKQEKKKTTNAC